MSFDSLGRTEIDEFLFLEGLFPGTGGVARGKVKARKKT